MKQPIRMGLEVTDKDAAWLSGVGDMAYFLK